MKTHTDIKFWCGYKLDKKKPVKRKKKIYNTFNFNSTSLLKLEAKVMFKLYDLP